VDPMKIRDIPIWGTVFEGRLFPLARSGSAAAPSAVPFVTAATHHHGDKHAEPHAGDPAAWPGRWRRRSWPTGRPRNYKLL
jgi:hypothetical protein